jgi:CshA-type fibril repeat protein
VQQANLLTNDNLRQVPATSVYLCGPSQTGATCSQTTLTVAGEGTYVINPTTGAISFTPVPLFVGTATPVTYAVVDILGGVSSTTYTPIVTPAVGPTATPETKSTLPSVPVVFNNITGTTPLATQGTGVIVPANTCLINPTNSASCTTSVTTVDGTWALDPATGLVTYTPNANVTRGTQTPVSYRVTDIHGQTATSTLTPIVPAAPTASPDSSSGSLNQTQTLTVLSNDSANTGPALDPTTVKFCGPSDTAPNCTQTSLTVAGKGVFTVNPTTGVVTFTPATGFYGSVPPIDYSVTNTLGEKATSTITVVVTYAPTAEPDVTSGLQGATQTSTLINNDSLAASPLATVALCGSGQTGAACNQTTITVANVGTYELDPITGVIVFTPLPNYIGTPAPLGYTITDTANLVASSTYTPTVTPIPVVAPTPAPVLVPPTAKPDASTGKKGATQSQNLFTGDEKGSGDLKTVSLCESVSNPSSCNLTSLVVAGVGSYALDATSGIITFTPEANFLGTAPPIYYTIIDANGLKAVSTYTPTVTDVPKPTAKPDTKVGNPNQAVTVKPVSNDIKAEAPLIPTTIALCLSDCSKLATGAPNETPSNPPIATAQGVWTVNANTGDVTFMPVKNWFGRASIGYVMYDTLGNPVISKITVVIPGSKLPVELVYTGDDPVAPAAPAGEAPSSRFPLVALLAMLVAFVATRTARKIRA